MNLIYQVKRKLRKYQNLFNLSCNLILGTFLEIKLLLIAIGLEQ